MSLFDVLEQRMEGIFESGRAMAPLPFKKLAKRAVKEMKRSAVKMDGRTFAPSLYTMLVNPGDDEVIAPLYQQVTDEMVDFIAHEAENGGYALMASPVVRFIADPNVKPGKTEIIAEVVTPDVLDSLRAEEAAYVQKRASANMRGTAIGGGRVSVPVQRPARPAQQARPAARGGAASLDDADRPFLGEEPAAARQAQPLPSPRQAQPARARQQQAAAGAAPESPRARRQQQAAPEPGTACELKDASTGRTWRVGVASTVIGRDEASADLVLDDTNVSRRHAELRRGPDGWTIADLGSTNGTRVNGMRVDEARLSSGDTVTLGLITLEFREL